MDQESARFGAPIDERQMFRLSCGSPGLAGPLTSSFEGMGLHAHRTAPTELLVDVPCGFAQRTLEIREGTSDDVVVLTENPCPEYWDDVWDLQPAGLLVGIPGEGILNDALRRVVRGERCRLTPGNASQLTATERTLLRAVAHGWDNRRIAQQLHIEDKTVRNTLTRIYAKLNVGNRVQATLYYWGRADLYR
jgi:DNA-binding NarL/FixJ family response regulator